MTRGLKGGVITTFCWGRRTRGDPVPWGTMGIAVTPSPGGHGRLREASGGLVPPGLVTGWSLAFLAFERYIVICKPFGNFRFNSRHALLVVAATWIIGVGVAIPPFFGWSRWGRGGRGGRGCNSGKWGSSGCRGAARGLLEAPEASQGAVGHLGCPRCRAGAEHSSAGTSPRGCSAPAALTGTRWAPSTRASTTPGSSSSSASSSPSPSSSSPTPSCSAPCGL